ncbi:hypothetical protein GCM10017711_32310 [Paeniglutamicibacter sulfureus]
MVPFGQQAGGLPRRGADQRKGMRVRGAVGPGERDGAKHLSGAFLDDRGTGAHPGMLFLAGMFRAEDLHRGAFGHGGAQPVGADIGFPPSRPGNESDALTASANRGPEFFKSSGTKVS